MGIMSNFRFRSVWIGLSALFLVVVSVLIVQLGHQGSRVISKTAMTNSYQTPKPVTASATPTPQVRPPSASPVVLGSSTRINAAAATHSRDVGIFISNVPGEAGSLETIGAIADMGCTIAYNYSLLDGSPDAIRSYLSYAAAHNLKIIVSLDNLYGSGGEATALQAVRDYGNNPAVWGFGISDEKPEGPADSPEWLPIISDRYHKVKQLTAKPVMSIAVGWSSGNDGQRATFLRSFGLVSDVLAIDSYPIPYLPATGFDQLLRDGPLNRERWFIAQAFSWSAYPDTANGLGYDLGRARYPTTDEMISMARQAIAGGATTIMYYSYFDISANADQLARLRTAINAVKGL